MSREKQIEKMAKEMCECCREAVTNNTCKDALCIGVLQHAEALYNAGYRKQIVGEWTYSENQKTMKCTRCRLRMKTYDVRRYCPNCGARMKGGAEL